MKYSFCCKVFLIVFLCLDLKIHANHSAALLTSTEGDPDGYIENCVNVIRGDYCESVTDLAMIGPDTLLLQRYYNGTNYITGKHVGGWRIYPQCFLVMGQDFNEDLHSINQNNSQKTYAFTGERSGGILTYSGWRTPEGITDDPLRIDLLNDGIGIVNTYAKEINGQTNHRNNVIHCNEETCTVVLGDGTRRVYEKVPQLPSLILGEELIPFLAAQVDKPEFFHLIRETLPSGNHIFFSYDLEGHISYIEMKNASEEKTISWIRLIYEPLEGGYLVKMSTSDEKTLEYRFVLFTLEDRSTGYALTEVKGSHQIPISYRYRIKNNLCFLVRKFFSKNCVAEFNYDDEGKIFVMLKPSAKSGRSEIAYTFDYENGYTDVKNSVGIKTRYRFDHRLQLTDIEKYDGQNNLYRLDQKFWGTEKENLGNLLAKSSLDGNRILHSYFRYTYDSRGNTLEKQLFGNLTGKAKHPLCLDGNNQLVDVDKLESYRTTFGYSDDGFNLLVRTGDDPENQTTYTYKSGTNLCIEETSLENNKVTKRICRDFNEDAVCIQIIEEDASSAIERRITNIHPKMELPGVGLPEIIEDKVVEGIEKNELLNKKIVKSYDNQGNLLVCKTYGTDEELAFSEQKEYNSLGQMVSETDILGRTTFYTYGEHGYRTSQLTSHDNKHISYTYNFRNQLTKTVEEIGDFKFTTHNVFDDRGRKIAAIDQFDNVTFYQYDDFGRLCAVIFPSVSNEEGKPIQPSFTYAYDIFGNVVSETDPRGYTTQKSYNFYGKVSEILFPDGSKESFKYYLRGHLYSSISRDGIATIYEYDSQKRLLSKKRFAPGSRPEDCFDSIKYKYTGSKCTEINNAGLITELKYDPFGYPIEITKYPEKNQTDESAAQKTEIVYDSLHRINKKKIWFDSGANDYSIEHFEYDLAGNVLTKWIEDHSGKVLLQRGFAYDTRGKVTEEYGIVDGEKKSFVKTSYNMLGEIIAHTDALENETKIHTNYGHYNDRDTQVIKKTIINPLGIRTEIEYDALARVVQIQKKDPADQLLFNQRILYDACGNKCCEIHDQIYQGQIIGNNISRWIYGPLGRLEEEIEASGTDQEKRTTYEYNPIGQLIAKNISGFFTPLTFTYHATGKLKSVKHENTIPNQKISTIREYNELESKKISNVYEYNEHGLIRIAKNERNKNFVKRGYNAFQQMTSETICVGRTKYTVDYTYDRKGRIKTIALPDQSSIAYSYDGIFCREIKRFSSAGELLYSHNYNEYDLNGRLLRETFGEVGQKNYEYDLNGKVTKINMPSINFTEKNDYDELGRLIQLTTTGPLEPLSTSFEYNELTQLISEKGQESHLYSYDSLDNRRTVDEQELVYHAFNQLKSDGNSQYSYDLQGNLCDRQNNQCSRQVGSNILSEVVQITKEDKSRIRYLYDPLGRRIGKRNLDAENQLIAKERFLYFGSEEVGMLDVEGKILQLRIPGIDGERLSQKSVAIELNDKCYRPIHGTTGNLIALADSASSSIVESYSYAAFGKEVIYNADGIAEETSPLQNPWRYAEKRVDQETGLVFFGRRYYDPAMARWISPDPIGTLDGPNSYAYVHNNPLNCFDRFGLSTDNEGRFYYAKSDYHMTPGNFCTGWATSSEIPVLEAGGGEGGNTGVAEITYPEITYNNSFEKMHTLYNSEQDFWDKVDCFDRYRPYTEPSHTYDLKLPESKNLRIGFINGINNSPKESRESAEYISGLAKGYNVHAVYNATHGVIADLYESKIGLDYIATEPVRQLHKMWNSYFDEADSNARFLMICHSQGAIHVRNALLDYPHDLRTKIQVVAIAPAAYIYQKSCSEVIHYRVDASRDIVPRFDLEGAKRSRETIVDLPSDANAPLVDHPFMSPTYEEALFDQIRIYLNQQR